MFPIEPDTEDHAGHYRLESGRCAAERCAINGHGDKGPDTNFDLLVEDTMPTWRKRALYPRITGNTMNRGIDLTGQLIERQ